MSPADEALVATWAAHPEWPRIRALLIELGVDVTPIDGLLARVRRDLWKDHSGAPRA